MTIKNIHYMDTDNTLVINDDIKFTYLMYGISITFISISASIQLVNMDKFELSLEIIFWLTFGAFSFINGLFLLLKRSIQQNIPIDTIKGLSRSGILDGNKCYIKLQNGKKRELPEIKTKDQFTELQKMLVNSGVGV